MKRLTTKNSTRLAPTPGKIGSMPPGYSGPMPHQTQNPVKPPIIDATAPAVVPPRQLRPMTTETKKNEAMILVYSITTS